MYYGDEAHHEFVVRPVLEVQDGVRLHEIRPAHGCDLRGHPIGHEDTDQLRTSPMVTGMVSLTSTVKRNT